MTVLATGVASHPAVTIVVCTRDRVASLHETLRSLDQLWLPADMTAEVLVVDNGSSDGTPELLAGTPITRFPFRAVREPRPGLSQARNAAIVHSRGKVLLWTDDDVRVGPQWLDKMARPILSGNADATLGSVSLPTHLQAAIFHTALRNRASYLACTATIDFARPDRMVGASMAFGRHVLEKVPDFDVRLGPGRHALGFGDDTLFSHRLLASGFRLVGVKDAIVEHHCDGSRLHNETIFSIARKMGRSDAYMDAQWRRSRRAAPWLRLAMIHVAHLILRIGLMVRGANAIDRDEETMWYEQRQAYWREFARQVRAISRPRE